jgi:hypothetical protein
MTSPKFARDTDNGRYYEDPHDGELVPSVTNVLDEWNIPALAPGAAKETAEYIVDHLPKAVRAALKPDTREGFLKEAKAHYKAVWERKADLGTRVHALAEAHILGKPMPDDPEAAPYVAQYERFLDDYGVDIHKDIEFTEVTVLRRTEPRYGGTADLGVHLRFPAPMSPQHPRWRGRKKATSGDIPTPSGLWFVDFKTSMTKPASAVYRDNLLQLAALRYAEVALLPDDSEVKVPEFVGAAILNLRTNSYGFVPLPADEAAHRAFLALVEVARFSHQIYLTPYKPIAAPGAATSKTKGAA